MTLLITVVAELAELQCDAFFMYNLDRRLDRSYTEEQTLAKLKRLGH